MKLREISSFKPILNAVLSNQRQIMVEDSGNVGGEIVDQIINHVTNNVNLTASNVRVISQLAPNAVYSGNMYRFLEVSDAFLQHCPSIQAMTAQLHEYALSFNREYFSWSKTINGIYEFAETGVSTTGLIICQDGTGLDIHKAYKMLVDGTNSMQRAGMSGYEKEEEVYAPMTNDVHVAGFYFKHQYYEASEFGEFVNFVQRYGERFGKGQHPNQYIH